MIDAKAKKFLEELLMTCGPSGFEFEQAKVKSFRAPEQVHTSS